MNSKKLEESALMAYPIRKKFNKKAVGIYDSNLPRRRAYIEGYQQALKDFNAVLNEYTDNQEGQNSR